MPLGERPMRSIGNAPRWLVAIAALALVALACEQLPVTGITCLQVLEDGTVIAPEQYQAYVSNDGGLTWKKVSPVNYVESCSHSSRHSYLSRKWGIDDPHDPLVKYRFEPQVSIERSSDGGRTWQQELDLSGTEARAVYYLQSSISYNKFVAGPLDAVFDPSTGNLIVAMGFEG